MRHWGRFVDPLKQEEEKLAEEEEAAKDDKAGGLNNDREGGPDGTREHLPTLVKEPSTEEADGSEKGSKKSLDEGMGEVQEMTRLKKEKDSALEAQQAAEQESRSITEQATMQVNGLAKAKDETIE